MRILRLFGQLDWQNFPERDPKHVWPGPTPILRASFVAAFLLKNHLGLRYMSNLRQHLVDHPALVWLFGFPLKPDTHFSWGFDVEASLPTPRHFGRVLRELPNSCLQFLLDSTVKSLEEALPPEINFGETISLDTTHIIAWVKENNPKAYVKESDRLNKERQPIGDPDCKLGCKKKHNDSPPDTATLTELTTTNATATTIAHHPTQFSCDQYFWGYASGIVATKVDGWGEFVLAELTQTFNHGDVTYFFPLMSQVEQRLGHRPRFGAFDKAFDAFYVYQYFDETGGFAAVPLKGFDFHYTFDEQGHPLCPAGLSMPLKCTFQNKTSYIEHERARYACPLLFPQPNGESCPIQDAHFVKGGCLTTLPTSVGNRIRYQLDRKGEAYKQVYKTRTATERINSLSKEMGLERPKLRRGTAIANQNTLIYVLLNLKALQRVNQKRLEMQA